MKAVILLCVVAVKLMVTEARNPMGIVYPFPIDSILRCRRPDPHKPGLTFEIPTPTIPLVPFNDTVWLPEEIRFRAPPGTIDTPWLIPLLPELYEGIHILNCDNPGPIRNPDDIDGSGIRPVMVDVFNKTEAQLLSFSTAEQNVIRNFWDTVGFEDCDVPNYDVLRLPEYYFPPCYVNGICSGESCSLPEGQRCLPSTRKTILLPVFRWDCCWDYNLAVWRWACGWYLVNIQIVSQCYCSCRPILS